MKQNIPIKKVQNFIKTLPEFKNFTVEPTNGGVSTDVYKLTKDDTTFYIRLSKLNENASTEVLAHKLMLKKGVRVPKIITYEDFNKQIDRSYMITSEIKGIPAKDYKGNLKKVAYEAGKQIALVNSIQVNGFGDFDKSKTNTTKLVGTSKTYNEYVFDMNRIENMLKDLISQNTIDKSTAKNCLSYIEKNKNLITCKKACLTHGDFNLKHIYINNKQYSGIIDFGSMRALSIYHDLSYFYIYSNEYFDNLLNGYMEIINIGTNHIERIEYLAFNTAIIKLWWLAKNQPNKLKRHSEIDLIHKVIKINA